VDCFRGSVPWIVLKTFLSPVFGEIKRRWFLTRLLLKLNALHDFSYDSMYFHKAQGFIYNLLRNTSFEKLHDSPGY